MASMQGGSMVVVDTPGMDTAGPCVRMTCPGSGFFAEGATFTSPGRGACIALSDGANLGLQGCLLQGWLRKYHPGVDASIRASPGLLASTFLSSSYGLCRGVHITSDEAAASNRLQGVAERDCAVELVGAGALSCVSGCLGPSGCMSRQEVQNCFHLTWLATAALLNVHASNNRCPMP